jgi:hypothetical protein
MSGTGEELIEDEDGKRRPRLAFEEYEVSNLMAGVEKFRDTPQRWRKILNAYKFNPRRTSVDLKDKWRNIVRTDPQKRVVATNPYHRKVPWTTEEIEALRAGHREMGRDKNPWANILIRFKGKFHPVRTSVHLKDKWRNLSRMERKRRKNGQPEEGGEAGEEEAEDAGDDDDDDELAGAFEEIEVIEEEVEGATDDMYDTVVEEVVTEHMAEDGTVYTTTEIVHKPLPSSYTPPAPTRPKGASSSSSSSTSSAATAPVQDFVQATVTTTTHADGRIVETMTTADGRVLQEIMIRGPTVPGAQGSAPLPPLPPVLYVQQPSKPGEPLVYLPVAQGQQRAPSQRQLERVIEGDEGQELDEVEEIVEVVEEIVEEGGAAGTGGRQRTGGGSAMEEDASSA